MIAFADYEKKPRGGFVWEVALSFALSAVCATIVYALLAGYTIIFERGF